MTRGSDVKVTGDLKVGGTVTINCSQTDAQKKEGPGSELGGKHARGRFGVPSLEAKPPLARQARKRRLVILYSLGVIAVHPDEAFAFQVKDDLLGGFLRAELGGVDV